MIQNDNGLGMKEFHRRLTTFTSHKRIDFPEYCSHKEMKHVAMLLIDPGLYDGACDNKVLALNVFVQMQFLITNFLQTWYVSCP